MKLRSNFVRLLIVLLISQVVAVASPNRSQQQGIPLHDAQWIWAEEDGPVNSWRCFRKEFDLNSIPESAVAKIAADSKYWLWINGKEVVFEGSAKRGPTPNGTYFDEIDILPFLESGKNSITALVWYWGVSGFSHRDSGKGGFYFSANLDNQSLVSDTSWKTIQHPAYSLIPTADPQTNYRLSEHNINYFAANNTIDGWHARDYKLTNDWVPAVEKGKGGMAPWGELRKNPLPQWLLTDLKDYENASELPKKGSLEKIIAKLPYNAQVIAYLKVNAPEGKVIDIRTDAYQDGGIQLKRPQYSVRNVYTTKDGIQEFEALAWINGHEVHYTIPEGVEILELKYRETGYATEFTGAFECDDEFYNKLWKMARRTLYVNMRDTFFDCPTRERAQWWGDVVNQLGEVFYTFDTDSHHLIRKAIFNLAEFQKPNGQLFAPVPGKDRKELPLQMLNSVGWYGFWTYYMNTGDAETIRDVYPYVKKYLSLWELGDDGLVVKRSEGMWFWVDWGSNSDYGVLQNCWYYLAQKAAFEMAILTGNKADVEGYRKNMKSIEDNFSKFWKADAYNSGQFKKPKDAPDDRANAMAVLCGLAPKEHYPAIAKVLIEQEFASPYMEKYVLEALCLMGEEKAALKRVKKRYEVMVDAPYSTLWEFWETGGMGTYNHGWNAPNTILSQYIAGVAPIEAGWRRYHIKPQLGSLNSARVRVPSVKGNIDVAIQKSAREFEINLNSPTETTAVVCIPKKEINVREIIANDVTIWKGEFSPVVKGISWAGENEDYIQFFVDPGVWSFSAKISGNKVDYFTNNGYGNAVGPPAGVHHNGVTYVAYQGPEEDAWVASYNHENGEWTGPFLAGISAMEQRGKIDNHGKPTLIIDDDGYIHIVYGGHGGTPELGPNLLGNYNNGEQRHVVSKNPLDITSWEQLENISPFGTYSELIKMDNGDLYLFYRHGAHRSNWVYQRSTDNGRSFADPVSIAQAKHRTDRAAFDSWYLRFVRTKGDKIAARVYYHICKDAPHHDGERQNGYYMEMSTKDHLWRNIHGEILKTPLTKAYADEHALVVNTGEKWVHGGPLALDSEGHPHFLLFLGDNTGHVHGGPKILHHYRWDGSNWLAHGGDPRTLKLRGNLDVDSPQQVKVLLADNDKLVWWNSMDGGKTLEPGETYFHVEGGSLLISGFIKNAHPDARFLASRSVKGTDFRRIYLVGDSGPLQRERTDAALLTEAQKALPSIRKSK